MKTGLVTTDLYLQRLHPPLTLTLNMFSQAEYHPQAPQSTTFEVYASASTLKDQLGAIEARSRQSEHVRAELRQRLRELQRIFRELEEIEDQEKAVTKGLQRELAKAREEVGGVWKFDFNFDAWKGTAEVDNSAYQVLGRVFTHDSLLPPYL